MNVLEYIAKHSPNSALDNVSVYKLDNSRHKVKVWATHHSGSGRNSQHKLDVQEIHNTGEVQNFTVESVIISTHNGKCEHFYN